MMNQFLTQANEIAELNANDLYFFEEIRTALNPAQLVKLFELEEAQATDGVLFETEEEKLKHFPIFAEIVNA